MGPTPVNHAIYGLPDAYTLASVRGEKAHSKLQADSDRQWMLSVKSPCRDKNWNSPQSTFVLNACSGKEELL